MLFGSPVDRRGQGRNVESERSVSNPEISIQQYSYENIWNIASPFSSSMEKKILLKCNDVIERAKTCLNIHTAPSINCGVIPAIALMEL